MKEELIMTETKKTTLAELLLRRKELNQLFSLRLEAQQMQVTKDVLQRRKVNDETDQVDGKISLVDKGALERESNFYAQQRRLADSVVQQANWTTEVEVPSSLMTDEEEEHAGTSTVKLAELLVRRKDLDQQIGRFDLYRTSDEDLYKVVSERLPIAKGAGEITEKVARLAPSKLKPFMHHDQLQKKLNAVDALIQRTNWDTAVEPPVSVLANFTA
jgi:hypothetical protein